MKQALTLIATSLLASCTTTGKVPEPQVIVQRVEVPVSAPCVPLKLGTAPVYVDNDAALKAAKDAAERYQLLWGGREQRKSRLAELETVVLGCPKAGK